MKEQEAKKATEIGPRRCELFGHLYTIKPNVYNAPAVIFCDNCNRRWWVGGEMERSKAQHDQHDQHDQALHDKINDDFARRITEELDEGVED